MCGRYFFEENIALDKYLKLLESKYEQTVLDLWCRGEVFPGTVDAVINSKYEPELMNWGMPLFSRTVINSRLESIRERRYYQDIIQRYRCAVPVSGFFEWDSRKQRHYVHTDDEVFYLAAIYQPGDKLGDYSIITKPATQTASIHNRAPVIMNEGQARQYLHEPSLETLAQLDPPVHIEYQQTRLELW